MKMNPEFKRILESKRAFRKQLAEKPISEKLRIVEELAERSLATRKDTSSLLPEEPWQVPKNWRWAHMGDVATIVGGSTPRTDRPEYFGGDVPWITPADLSGYKEKTISRGARNITQEGLENSGARLVPAKTILFSSRAPIGYVAIASNPVATNQGFKSFVLNDELLPDFVYYYLQRAKEFAVALASGTTFLEISGKNAARLPIPVPPLTEQRRIVEEIEKQFTRLEAGVAALRRVQANLKRYRAAVLKAACEGRLVPTEAELARAGKVDPNCETGEALLARILGDRRSKWQNDRLSKMVAEGRTPKNDNWKAQYKQPDAPDTSSLPVLPEGWVWVKLGQLAWSVKDGPHYSPKYASEGVPFISGGNIRPSGVDFDNARRISPELHAELSKRCKPEVGDILYTKGGTTGIARVNTYTEEFNVWVHVAVLKLVDFVHRFYIQHTLNSPLCYAQAQKLTHGVGNQDLGLTRMIHIILALPPLAEQERIVAEVERRLSMVEELETVVSANLRRATRLRLAILQKAFSGKLF